MNMMAYRIAWKSTYTGFEALLEAYIAAVKEEKQ